MNKYNFDELQNSVKALKKKEKLLVNNCYMMPAVLKQKIEDGKIFFDVFDDSVIIYEENGIFYNAMFYIGENEKELRIRDNINILSELIYFSGRPFDEKIERFFDNSSLKRFSKAYGMIQDNFDYYDTVFLKNKLDFAEKQDADDILSLWESVFDVKTVSIDTPDELCRCIENKQVICVKDDEGKICGAAEYEFTGNNVIMIKHVAVDEKMRGRGMGGDILAFLAKSRETSGFEKICLWVEDYRKNAIKMYEKKGFKYTGKEMLRYVK